MERLTEKPCDLLVQNSNVSASLQDTPFAFFPVNLLQVSNNRWCFVGRGSSHDGDGKRPSSNCNQSLQLNSEDARQGVHNSFHLRPAHST